MRSFNIIIAETLLYVSFKVNKLQYMSKLTQLTLDNFI